MLKTPPTCPYCGNLARLIDGRTLYRGRYPHLFQKRYWVCAPCDAHVGCHEGTSAPFGTMAKPQLRLARRATHEAFDQLWKSGLMSRKQAYAWLAEHIGKHKAHIGLMDERQCAELRDRVYLYLEDLRILRMAAELEQAQN